MVSHNDQGPTMRFPIFLCQILIKNRTETPPNCHQIRLLSTKTTTVHNVWSSHTIWSQITCCTGVLESVFMAQNLLARNVKFWSRRFRKYIWKCGKSWILYSAPIFPEPDWLDLILCASRSHSFVWSRRYSIFRSDVVGTEFQTKNHWFHPPQLPGQTL